MKPTDIYLSRARLIGRLWFCDSPELTPEGIKAVVEEIQKVPAADVRKVKRGTWKRYPCVWECSECTHMEDIKREPPPFCSQCGAENEVKT